MNKQITIITILVFAIILFAFNSYADENELSINLSDASLQINSLIMDLKRIDNEVSKYDYEVKEHSYTMPLEPHDKVTVHIYLLKNYPIYFVQTNNDPIDKFGVIFDDNKNKFSNTKLSIYEYYVNNNTSLVSLTEDLRRNKAQYSVTTISPEFTNISVDSTDFVIDSAIFKDGKIDSIVININTTIDKTPNNRMHSNAHQQ